MATAATKIQPSSTFLPAIHGLRAVAVLPVMGFHLITNFPRLKSVFDYGWAGVDLFFVISGFLITGILLDSRDNKHRWINFYMRRILKIWPLYYALLGFMFLVVPAMRPTDGQVIFAKSSPWWSYLFFLQNFFVKGLGAGALGLTWSLAIEEQFYLIWPLLVFTMPKRVLEIFLALAFFGTLGARFWMITHGHTQADIYINFFCRLDGLVLGSALALWQRATIWSKQRDNYVAAMLAIVGIMGLLWFGLQSPTWTYTFLAMAFTSAVALAARPKTLPVFEAKIFVFIGTISYGLYLLHVVAYDVLRSTRLGRLGWISGLLMVMAAFIISTCSWYLFERPILSLKRRFA